MSGTGFYVLGNGKEEAAVDSGHDPGRMRGLSVNGTPFCRVRVARTPWLRLRGWIGRRPEPDEALWLEPCSAVHTFGMVVPIDVVFVDGQGRVLKVVSGLRPFRFAACPGAAAAVELPAGRALGITEGSVLEAV